MTPELADEITTRNLGQSPTWNCPVPKVRLGGKFRGLLFPLQKVLAQT